MTDLGYGCRQKTHIRNLKVRLNKYDGVDWFILIELAKQTTILVRISDS